MADGKVTIQLSVEDKDSANKVRGLEKAFNGVDGTAKKATGTIKQMVTSLGLVKIASKAFEILRQSIDGAISRVDTMNQFPKMMEAIGFGADESQQAVDALLDGIQGLPTRLDEVVSTAQGLAIMTGDLEQATELTLALNNAFLASGASQADASRGLEQYRQMLSSGKVDMQSWRTLQETMGVALNDVAKAFGFAGASAQNDLYSALQEGTITFDEFNAKIIELSDGVGGFAERALIASAGIRTSFANIRTAVVNGLATMIQTVDEAMKARGFGSIADALDGVKVLVQDAFGVINRLLPPIVNLVLDIVEAFINFRERFDWVVTGINAGIVAFVALSTVLPIIIGIFQSLMAWVQVISMIRSLNDAVTLLTMAFPLLANPVFWIATAIGALVAVGVLLYRNWETISEWASNLASTIGGALSNAVEKVAGYFESLGFNMDWLRTGFSNLTTWVTNLWSTMSNFSPLEAVQNLFGRLWDTISNSGPVQTVIGLFGNLSFNAESLRAGLADLVGRAGELWETFRNSTVFEYLGVAIGIAVDKVVGFKDAIVALVQDFDLGPMLEQVVMFIPKLLGIFVSKKLGLVLAGANIIQSIAEGMGMTVPELFEMVTDIIVGFIETFTEQLPAVIETGVQMLTGLIEGFTTALPAVVEAVIGILMTITDTLIGSLTMLIELGVQMISALVEGIVTALPVILDAMLQVIMAIVEITLTLLPMLLGVGIEILMAIVFGILEVLPVLIETFITVLLTVIDTIITLLPQLIELGIMIITSLLEGILSMLPVIIEAGISLILSLAEAFITMLPVIIDAGIQLLMGLIEGIISILPALIEAGISLIMALVDAFIGMLPVLIEAGIQILMALIGGLVEVLPALIEAGIQIILALVDAFISLLPVLIEAGIQILMALIEGIISIVPQLLPLGLSMIVQLGGAILSMLPTLLNAGVQLLVSLISGVLSMVGSLLSAGRSLITQLLSAILSFGGRMMNAGRDLLDRVKSGITSRVGSLVSAINTAIQKVWNKIKEWFGRFKTAGSNIIGNIAEGITGAVGKVTGAVSNVVGKIRDFFPFSPAKEGPLKDLDHLDFAGPMTDSIDNAKRPLSRAMNDLMKYAQMDLDTGLNLPNADILVNRAVASGTAGGNSVDNSNVVHNNGITINIEKIENNTDGDIEEQLEEAVWVMDSRSRGRL